MVRFRMTANTLHREIHLLALFRIADFVSARRLERECGAVIDALTVARVNTGRHSLRVPCADFAADSGLGGMVEGFCGSTLLVDHDQRVCHFHLPKLK